jgi:pyrimidine operon attenuation protein/uracil phosphoribosyltransferase
MRTVYEQADVAGRVAGLADEIAGEFSAGEALNVIGIRTRGETLGRRLLGELKSRGFGRLGWGVLDITLYRDDLSEIGPKPMVRPTHIDIDLNARPLVLVDDVLFTGRSIRAALDAISDFGRPSVIRLAVLVDRGGRELPIQADFVGLKQPNVPRDHRVNVRLGEIDGKDEIVIEPR